MIALLGLVTILFTMGCVLAGYFLIGYVVWRCSLEGKIHSKRIELMEHRKYMKALDPSGESRVGDELRGSYKDVAAKREANLEVELESLLIERERQEFEERMKN